MLIDRLIKNWKTTTAALIPAVVAISAYLGTDIDPEKIKAILGAAYAIILLFSRDAATTAPRVPGNGGVGVGRDGGGA